MQLPLRSSRNEARKSRGFLVSSLPMQDVIEVPLVSTIIKRRRLLAHQPSTKLLVVVLVRFWLVRLFRSLRVCRIAFGYCWNRYAHACHSAWNLESAVISDPSPSLITYLLTSISSPRLRTCTCTYRDSVFSILCPHSPLAVSLYFDQSPPMFKR